VLATARTRVSPWESVRGRGEDDLEAWGGPVIEMLDHTADVGFELSAPTLGELFEEARRALLLVAFERPPESGHEEREVRLSAPDRETLLVRWLNELIYLLQDAGYVPVRAELEVGEAEGAGCEVRARLAGAPPLLEEYGWQGEIKSATFHGLDVIHVDGGWRARVILDV
jgi:SHS2 domain-containing protein